MSNYIYYGKELYHHGIKGQKWGTRRWQNEDGSLTPAGREHYGYGSAKGTAYRLASKVYSLNEKTYNKLGNKTLVSMNKAAKNDMLKKAEKADKAAAEKKEKMKKTVKEYTKQYDKASNMEDKSDELFRKAKEQHKALGNTPLSRMKAVYEAQKGRGSKAAKEYLKTWNEAEKLGDKAYDEWQKADELYKKTGKNKLSRILNNVKYS